MLYTFYGVGVVPCIAVFTAHQSHPADKVCRFINFEDDGFRVFPHLGLLETESAKDKKQHLLDVWFGRVSAETKFCVESTVEAEDEWLHSFYYFNDEIPMDSDFDKTIGDFLSFEFSMIMQGQRIFFSAKNLKSQTVCALSEKKWKEFPIDEIFTVESGKRLETRNKIPGTTAFIGATDNTNGVTGFVGNDNSSRDKNVLGVNYNGAPCIAFYHPYECLFSDDVKRLHLRNNIDNEFVLEFFATVIEKQRDKYNYGYKCNEKRMIRQKIVVPIT